MNTDKAYLFGVVVGGGVWSENADSFQVKLPYRQWGAVSSNPQRVGDISRDIMTIISPIFQNIYGITVSYEASEKEWIIYCEGNTSLLANDLHRYGIENVGEIRAKVSIANLIPALIDDNLKRRFVAGLADTIGSTSPSHRRFTEETQIISFEISGFNFKFICELCRLLYSINCIPDQILWNHPNFHAANDPYYQNWTKGFKLRVKLDQYSKFGAFAFRSRAKSAQDNLTLQRSTSPSIPCPDRKLKLSPSCIHPAEHDTRFPDEIRDGHYLHNRHVCAVLGCEHAPYSQIENICTKAADYINPFSILSKDSRDAIHHIVSKDPLMAKRVYRVERVSIQKIFDCYKDNKNTLLYGSYDSGYPIVEVMQAVAYVIALDSELSGKRPRGSLVDLISAHLSRNRYITVECHIPDLLTPLLIYGGTRGALVGPKNPRLYNRLISISPENKYKLLIRNLTEEDFYNAK